MATTDIQTESGSQIDTEQQTPTQWLIVESSAPSSLLLPSDDLLLTDLL